MASLHIVQGGVDNGDKAWLEKAARQGLRSGLWIAPKSAQIGDTVVIYVAGHGFFATARVASVAKRRRDWKRRYGARLDQIQIIKPPISLGVIRKRLPRLHWAKYPRSITTATPQVAAGIRQLVTRRRTHGAADIDDNTIEGAGLDELRALALLNARASAKKARRTVNVRQRSRAVHLYVLRRADGYCEGCTSKAPFQRDNEGPYLEPHHTKQLADEGPDHPRNVIALCPNCHRRAHYSADRVAFSRALIRKLQKIERNTGQS